MININWQQLILLVSPLFFIVPFVFTITMKLLAYFSGWERLATSYQFYGNFDGKIYHRQSARIKWTSYKGCLQVGGNEEGLYLAQMWVFSLFHKPLLIPWEKIEAEYCKMFIVDGYRLKIVSHNSLTILLYGKVFELIKEIPHVGEEDNFS